MAHTKVRDRESKLARESVRTAYLNRLSGGARSEAKRIVLSIEHLEEILSQIDAQKNAHLRSEKSYSQLALSMHGIGKKKAAVAVARKMLETFYCMLKTGELYRDIPSKVYQLKLRRYGLT